MALKLNSNTIITDSRTFKRVTAFVTNQSNPVNSGNTISLDTSLNYHYIPISATTTITFDNTNVPANTAKSMCVFLGVTGSVTVNWPSSTSLKWPGGAAAPHTADRWTMFYFITENGGTTWYGYSPIKNLYVFYESQSPLA